MIHVKVTLKQHGHPLLWQKFKKIYQPRRLKIAEMSLGVSTSAKKVFDAVEPSL